MKRKMIGAAAAYMSGLFFASFFTGGSDWLLLAGLFPMFFIIAWCAKVSTNDKLMLTVFFVLSFTSGELYDRTVFDRITAFNGTTGSFEGSITDVSYYDDEKALYTLDGSVNGSQSAKITFYGEAYEVSYGDTMRLEECEFALLSGDYLFDSSSYYKGKGIFLEAENAGAVEVIRNDGHIIKRAADSYRDKVISDFRIKLGEDCGALLAGMVFGETYYISDNTQNKMYRSGIGHILAVSGLHVSAVAACLLGLLKKLRLNRYIRFALLNVFLGALLLLVESPVSAIRAAFMLDMMYAAMLFRRQNNSLNSIAAAVLIICIMNPYVIYDRGFLLSVSGTWGIAVFAPYMTEKMNSDNTVRKLIKNTAVMGCTSLAVLPLSILFFDETSLLSPVTNVLLSPLCIGAMLCGMLYTFTGGSLSLLSVAELLCTVITAVTDFIADLSIVHVSCGTDNLFMIALLCAGFVLLMYALSRSRKITSLALAGALSVFIFSSSVYGAVVSDRMRVAVLGRGTNSAVVITCKGSTMVIDLSGHFKNPEYVRKYLISNGIGRIDCLVLYEDVQSMYTSYITSLDMIETGNIFVSGETPIYSGEAGVTTTGDGAVTLSNDLYSLMLDSGTLTISYGDNTMTLAHASKYNGSYTENCVYYGNIPSSVGEIHYSKSCIFLDTPFDTEGEYCGINNFEITLSSDNEEFGLRRL